MTFDDTAATQVMFSDALDRHADLCQRPYLAEPDGSPRDLHERAVARELARMRAAADAKARFGAEDRDIQPLPALEGLDAMLARAIATPMYRIAELLPQGGRALLAAQFKAGKTTLVGNLARALADGDAFLGQFAVRPIADGSIGILDFEMGDAQLQQWLGDQAIQHSERVVVMALRGKAGRFDLRDPAVRATWAAVLRQARVRFLVLDCVRPILDALCLDEHRDAGVFLTALDALLVEAGVSECVVIHHMGHTAERARGDSRFRDWPDVEWRLVRQSDDPGSARFFSAYGRDVDVPETRLDYDRLTRRLTVAGGSRADGALNGALAAVIDALRAAGAPLTGRRLKTALRDAEHGRNEIDAALKYGVRVGALTMAAGQGNSHLYSVGLSVPLASEIQGVSGDTLDPTVSPLDRDTHSPMRNDHIPAVSHRVPAVSRDSGKVVSHHPIGVGHRNTVEQQMPVFDPKLACTDPRLDQHGGDR